MLKTWGIILAVVTGLAAGAQPAAAGKAKYELKIATLAPSGTGWEKVLKKYEKAVEKASGGQINVRVFLGPSETVSNAIADEWAQPALHYGTAVNGYWRALWFVLGLAPCCC